MKQLAPAGLVPVGYRDSWWYPIIVHEPFTGAWQRNMELRTETALSNSTVFACISLISGDISKLRPKLVQRRETQDVWLEITSPAFSPVLRKPNNYQNRIRFIEMWIASKLIRGNTYVFKERDDRNVVVGLHILDPLRCKPLLAPNGDVYYQIDRDDLAGVESGIVLPASEIIHDRMNCFYHPLVGLSPLHAGALAITQGINIQEASSTFFQNQLRPSGILTAPGLINNDTAERIKTQWQDAATGKNVGKIIVAGDDLKFHAMSMTAEDSQLIEQAKMTAEIICSLFHVPPYMVGLAAPPAYNNIAAQNTMYYTQCLQNLIESLEVSLDEGLGLTEVSGKIIGVELDLDGLLRLDVPTLYNTINTAVGGGWLAPDEGRERANYPSVPGGGSPMMQQQVFSLAALAKRDENNPFPAAASSGAPAVPSDDDLDDDVDEDDEEEASATAQLAVWELRRALAA